jgi:redox-sensitive bicupin YhaK (pirin superfamily)
MPLGYGERRNMIFLRSMGRNYFGGMKTLRRSDERGHVNHGWLDTYHTFSFGDYYDPNHMGFRTLRVINDDKVAPGEGFGTHPHRDMEIITYVLSGALEHKDSMGNGRVIRPGEFQYMAAGSGVTHSEFNPSGNDSVHLLQIWIMPERRGIKPQYAEKSSADVKEGEVALIASKSGRGGSMAINQDANLLLARLAPGQKATHNLEAGRYAWVHVAEGELVVNGETLRAGDAVALSNEAAVELSGGASTSQVLIFDLN